MNFLGHLYLAGDDRNLRFGNFIADHIKGIAIESYPPEIARGIMMHRAIDYFTDSHPAMSECRQYFRPAYQKYAGVVLDVVLDYFLCREWALLSPRSLRPFIYQFYLQLLLQWHWLPPRFCQMAVHLFAKSYRNSTMKCDLSYSSSYKTLCTKCSTLSVLFPSVGQTPRCSSFRRVSKSRYFCLANFNRK